MPDSTGTSACPNSTQRQQRWGARIEPVHVHVEHHQDVDDDECVPTKPVLSRFLPIPFLHTHTNTTRTREKIANSYYATQQPD